MKFTESTLEQAIIELIHEQGISFVPGKKITRDESEVLIVEDLTKFLQNKYKSDNITENEIKTIITELQSYSSADLYTSNKEIMDKISNGFILPREDTNEKDLYIYLIDYSDKDENIYKIVNQMEIVGSHRRIPDGILYINGLPLVVFEFKSAILEDTTIHDAYVQLTTRYKRDIPELFKYNAFCVISDGANNKAGSFFAPYEFFYAWRKITGDEDVEKDGIDSLFTMIQGMFDKTRLRDIIQNFIFFPDTPKREDKIFCRYPQYYASKKLYNNILTHRKPDGDGKGGTYFGATGCGKSFAMLFLTRLLMRSKPLGNPTIVLITDRSDLDDQLAKQFTNAKEYIGDKNVISVESREKLREYLKGRDSGGVFLTTIQKFTEDTELLTDRTNVICISDEAHRTQTNLDQKITVNDGEVRKSYGFAKYLHDSLPNATYVGFTGTPIDATLDVFGDIVDYYTMNESVKDEITVRIVYEGRAAKLIMDNSKLKEIEEYYEKCAEEGATEYAIEESKKANAKMSSILGDPDRIKSLAEDFVKHYEKRVEEGSSIKGKAMFVSSSRLIGYEFYKEVIKLRPEWNEIKEPDDTGLSERELKDIKPMEKIKMIMTRGQDDKKELYDMLGTSKDREELDRQFKKDNSNFKIAIVVDMWLTGFDVPALDTIYIDKPIQKHNLIQTISRVNRKFEDKDKGLVVDYIGIKRQMDLALAHYSKTRIDGENIEYIEQSVEVVKNHLELLNGMFNKFDTKPYFEGSSVEKLKCLNMGSEFVQVTKEIETRFMDLVKKMKLAYDICCGSEDINQKERDTIHFYLAIRSIVFKITKGNAPDTTRMNKKVQEMIKDALQSDGVEEIFKIGDEQAKSIDIFDEEYLAKIEKIKLPNHKIKLLHQLLSKAIEDFKKTNKVKGIEFSEKFRALLQKYNDRKEQSILQSEVLAEFTDEILDLYEAMKKEKSSFEDMGIGFEEKAFYDILKELARKYEFEYPEDKLITLSKEVKKVVDDKAKYTDWNKREDIKADLHANLIVLLAEHDYPPVDRDEVYKEIFEQAENFKKNKST